jgi:hypothetical protein
MPGRCWSTPGLTWRDRTDSGSPGFFGVSKPSFSLRTPIPLRANPIPTSKSLPEAPGAGVNVPDQPIGRIVKTAMDTYGLLDLLGVCSPDTFPATAFGIPTASPAML